MRICLHLHRQRCVAILFGVFLFCVELKPPGQDGKRRYIDPSVPSVSEIKPVPPPPPSRNSSVKFHRKPNPLASGAVTNDWPCFLGPTHNGISSETKLLKTWTQDGPPLVWEMEKGSGYSSPAILGDRLILLHRKGDEETVECLNTETGHRYWNFRYPTHFSDRYGYNNGPRSSPIIDDGRVYTVGAEGKLHCLKLDTGQLFWKRDIAREFKVPQDFFGTASTPLIRGDLLFVNIGAPGGPCVGAFDKHTGRMVWGAGDQWGPSYASPVPALIHGKPRILVFAGGDSQPPSGGLLSIDPQTGAVDFQFPWRSRSYESVNASCPVAVGNQVFVSASYRTGGVLLDLLPNGGYQEVWTNHEFGLHFNTAIHREGYLYGFDGRNEPDAALACIELKTGKTKWRQALEWEETIVQNGEVRKQRLGTFRGTLLWADGGFFCLGELGHLLRLELSPEGYKEKARAWLFAARESWALPVLSRGLLYVCQNSRGLLNGEPPRLLCFDLRAK